MTLSFFGVVRLTKKRFSEKNVSVFGFLRFCVVLVLRMTSLVFWSSREFLNICFLSNMSSLLLRFDAFSFGNALMSLKGYILEDFRHYCHFFRSNSVSVKNSKLEFLRYVQLGKRIFIQRSPLEIVVPLKSSPVQLYFFPNANNCKISNEICQ